MKKILLLSLALMGMSVLGWGQSIFDEMEPNDTFDSANNVDFSGLSVTIRAAINSLSDVDFFKIEVPREGVLSLRMENLFPNAEITIFDPARNIMRGPFGFFEGFNQILPKLCAPGVYFIRVRAPFSITIPQEDYRLVLNYNTDDVHECNDTFFDATPYTGQMQGAIYGDSEVSPGRDKDIFKFVANTSNVTIAVTQVPSNIRILGELADEFDNKISTTTGVTVFFSSAVGISAQGLYQGLEIGKEYFLTLRDFETFFFNTNPNLYTLTINGAVTSHKPSLLAGRLRVYPNPARDQLVVDLSELPAADQRGTLYVYNTLGQLLRTEPIPTPTHRLDVQALPPGLLLLEYRTNGQRITQTVVRE